MNARFSTGSPPPRLGLWHHGTTDGAARLEAARFSGCGKCPWKSGHHSASTCLEVGETWWNHQKLENYGTTKEKHWICIFFKDESSFDFFVMWGRFFSGKLCKKYLIPIFFYSPFSLIFLQWQIHWGELLGLRRSDCCLEGVAEPGNVDHFYGEKYGGGEMSER